MWIEFIRSFTTHVRFEEPASPQDIAELESRLSVTLPNDLSDLLTETNGAIVSITIPGTGDEGLMTMSLIWSVSEIVEENLFLRTFDAKMPSRFPPLTPLLFFASEPNGDLVAFQKTNETSIARVSHEDYGERTTIALSLRDYLKRLLGPMIALVLTVHL